jgi:MFS family permease
MAIISSYKEKRELYIAYFEVICGLGAFVGPLIGALFYYFFGYIGPFFGIGFIYFLMVIIFYQKKKSIITME